MRGLCACVCMGGGALAGAAMQGRSGRWARARVCRDRDGAEAVVVVWGGGERSLACRCRREGGGGAALSPCLAGALAAWGHDGHMAHVRAIMHLPCLHDMLCVHIDTLQRHMPLLLASDQHASHQVPSWVITDVMALPLEHGTRGRPTFCMDSPGFMQGSAFSYI